MSPTQQSLFKIDCKYHASKRLFDEQRNGTEAPTQHMHLHHPLLFSIYTGNVTEILIQELVRPLSHSSVVEI